MHCPDEFKACVDRLNEIKAADPERYSSIVFLIGAADWPLVERALSDLEVDA